MSQYNDARGLLATHGWLSQASPNFRAAVLNRGVLHAFEGGQTVLRGGELSGALVGIASGEVGISWYLGTSDRRIGHVGQPGTWWGLSPAVARPCGVEMVALTEAQCLLVDHAGLARTFDETAGSWRDFGLLAYDIAVQFGIAHDDLMIRNDGRRCLAVLLRITGLRGPVPFHRSPPTVHVSHNEIAEMSNLSRSFVSKFLHDLEQRGLIGLGYRSVRIRNPAELLRLMEQG